MMAKVRRYLIQAGLWALFYFLPYMLSFKGQTNIYSLFESSGDITHLISFLLLIAYSYFNYFWLIPKFYLKKKYIIYIFLLIVCFVIVIKVPQFFEPLRHPKLPFPAKHFTRELPAEPMPILFGMNYNIILFLASCFVALSVQHRMQLFQIEKEKLNAEVSFLKAQINPHFLFNTLNSIYALALQKSDDTPNAVIQLSEMMRYLLKEASTDFVPLAKELSYINNYVLLQKRRLGDTVLIDYDAPPAVSDYTIAPLMLMSFIENAFKHGVNPDEDSEITIHITLAEGRFHLLVKNKKVSSVSEDEAVGIGLKNTIARLERLYPGRHELKIEDAPKVFTINLTINLA